MPVGYGFLWKGNNIFTKKMMTNRSVSLESLQWITYINDTDPRFIDSKGNKIRIQNGWMGSEMQIGPYYVDGYCQVDDVIYALEYNGCRYHGCDICKIAQPNESDVERESFIKSKVTELIIERGCIFQEKLKRIRYDIPSYISHFLYKNKITATDIIKAIINQQITGFIVVDIEPTQAAEKYRAINFLPIFQRKSIEFDMLPEWMKPGASKASFPRTTLVQTMRATSLLLHTELARFYLRNGFAITKIHLLLEYEPSMCFEQFYHKSYELRVQATIQKNTQLTSVVKTTMNSCK